MRDMLRCVLGFTPVLLIGACTASTGPLSTRLTDFNPNVRIEAILEVTRLQRRDLLPGLVERLDDEDPAVRFYAILGLEKLTGTRLGYSYAAGAAQRREAVERWRRHVQDSEAANQSSGPKAAHSGGGPVAAGAEAAP